MPKWNGGKAWGGSSPSFSTNWADLGKPTGGIGGWGNEAPGARDVQEGKPKAPLPVQGPIDWRQGLPPRLPGSLLDIDPPVTPPVTPPNKSNRFELWQPQGGEGALQGLAWNPDFHVNIPEVNPNDPTAESKIQSANYLNWFNQIFPYMSPADRMTYSEQVLMSLDSLDDPEATSYFRNMMRAGANAKEGQWTTTGTDYGDRDRLREILRATMGYASIPGANGASPDLNESEKWSQDAIDLLTALVGGGGGPGGMNTQGVWSEDRPMSRRERRDFWNLANTYADAHPDDPFAATLMSMLSPTVSTPQLTTAIGGPAQNSRGGSTKYAYGNQGYY